MYPVTAQFKQAIKEPTRLFNAKVILNGVEYTDENIVDMKLDETVNPDESLTLGSVASSKIEINLINTENVSVDEVEDASVEPYIGLEVDGDIEFVPLGKFIVDDVNKNKGRLNITAFDNMIKLEKPYNSSLNYPTSINQVALEIAQLAGVSLVGTLPNTFIPKMSDITLRQAIGYIASFMGGFARFNRDGDLEITSYVGTNEEITADNYIDLNTAEKPFTVGKIGCKVPAEDGYVELVVGEGGSSIYFEHPFMTQAQLDLIYDDLKTLSYMPYDMPWQGNPALMAGDKITIVDLNDNVYETIVMEQSITYTGGLSATATAKAKTETAQEFSYSGTISDRLEKIEQKQASEDPDIIPAKPEGLEAIGIIENILIRWEYDGSPHISNYEVYASQVEGFVPNESNLVWRGRTSSYNFFVNDEDTWYFLVRAINNHGNAGPFSDYVQASGFDIKGDVDQALADAQIAKNTADQSVATANLANQNAVEAINQAQDAFDDAQEALTTAQGFGNRISDAEDNISTLKQTTQSFATRIENAEGDISTLTQTATGLQTRMTNAEGNISTLTQTASSLDIAISDLESETQSQITQLSNNINLRVLKGDIINQINISTEDILISGKKLILDGDTTVTGTFRVSNANITSVDAGKMTTGELDAALVNIINLNASNISAGTINGIDIIGSTITSYNNATNDVITLENGRIETFVGGNRRFGVYGNGLVAYGWSTGEEVASFRSSKINNESYGADIVGYGDYFVIGKHIGGGTSRNMLFFDWRDKNHLTRLYGGSGEHDSGRLELFSTSEGGTAGMAVPHLVIDNWTNTSTNTAYSGIRAYIGRDNRSSSSSNFRSSFEIWQYRGDRNGGIDLLFDLDTTTSGQKYLNAWVDKMWVDGDVSVDGKLTANSHVEINTSSALYVRRLSTHGYVDDNRWVTLGNWTVGGESGVGLVRGSESHGAMLFLGNNMASLVEGDKQGSLDVTRDSSGALVRSMAVFNRTYTATTQMMRVTDHGTFGRSTSSRRYKLLEEPITLEYAKRILNVQAKTWFDKRAAEEYAETLSTGVQTEEQAIRRIPGLIAEDMHDAGLELLVNYDDQNRPDGIASNAWVLHTPLIADLYDQVDELNVLRDMYEQAIFKIAQLEQRINYLEVA